MAEWANHILEKRCELIEEMFGVKIDHWTLSQLYKKHAKGLYKDPRIQVSSKDICDALLIHGKDYIKLY